MYLIAETKGSIEYWVDYVSIPDPSTGSWQDRDLDDYTTVPEDASGAFFRVVDTSTQSDYRAGLRKNGPTWAFPRYDCGEDQQLILGTGIDDGNIYEAYYESTSIGMYLEAVTKYIVPTNYELDLEVQWTTADYDETNEYLCINTGSTNWGDEDIKVDVWNTTLGDWDNLISDLASNTWNNYSISGYLTSVNLTIRFLGGSESSDANQDSWDIECSLIHVWSTDTNYQLDLEIQWTNADYTRTNEELCIKTGTTDAEDIKVDVWNGSAWVTLITDLNPTSWNNVSVSDYLTNSTFTIRFNGGNETDDTNPDSWNIDATLLHIWTTETYDYVLKAVNQVESNWTVNLQVYDNTNISRLSSLNISLHDGTSSSQIAVSGGNITNSEGDPYNLPGGQGTTIYISMSNLLASTSGTSYVYVHLRIQVPNISTYILYVIIFKIT